METKEIIIIALTVLLAASEALGMTKKYKSNGNLQLIKNIFKGICESIQSINTNV